ncbi:MAG TPA: hypothetical protein VN676_17095, partial [Steroidobacteraceae bacterium]|nr:hypothetical protein [Steroidobacteraceae bacterium]
MKEQFRPRHVAALWLAGALVLSAGAFAQAPGERSAVIPTDCNRACLLGFVHSYMDALVHKDPSRAHFAKDVRFTENDVEMPLGRDGLWGSISGVAPTGLEVADTTTGNAAWFGTVEEHGEPAYYAMRIKVRDGQIAEVETVVDRKGSLPAPFGDPAKLVHDPAFAEVLQPSEQRARERLIAVANGYFSTVELNDGQVLTSFDDDCQRTENGISTTSGNQAAAAIAQGCEAQFKLGLYRINKRVRERRYELVDEERGVVVATGFFDHANTFDHYKTNDGKERKTALKWPNSITLMEAFKIRAGKIYRVEAVFTYVPYFMHNPWAGPAARVIEAAPHPKPDSCAQDCLIGIANKYMAALAAQDPSRVPWAPRVRYTENSVSMMIGDGIWKTVTAVSKPLYATDPSTGNVAWYGLIEEHGQPAYYAMRLKVEDGKVAEVETVISRSGYPGPFGDPTKYAHDPAFGAVIPRGERQSRKQLVDLVNGYFSTLQLNDGTVRTKFDPDCQRNENGVSTTSGTTFENAVAAQGCEAQFKLGLYRYDDRVRGRRFELVDEEHGIVVATG